MIATLIAQALLFTMIGGLIADIAHHADRSHPDNSQDDSTDADHAVALAEFSPVHSVELTHE